MASSTRQQKFAKLIQREISSIFQKDKKGYMGNTFISIADVKMSPDLSIAKIYVSAMLAPDKPVILDKLNTHKKEIRKDLGIRIGKQVRIVPELIFFIDEVEENAHKIEELLKSLNIPPAPGEKK